MMGRLWAFWLNGVVLYEGSTRAVSLMRILLAILLWTRWARELLPWRSLEPERLLLSVAFYTFTTLMFYGLFTRVAMVGASITMLFVYYYFGFVAGVEPWTHHHTYLLVITTCWMSFTPCGGSYSLDRYRSVRRAEREGVAPPAEWGPLWATRLIALQVTSLYLWTAYDKTFWGFLSGERMEQIFMYLFFGSDHPGLWFTVFCIICAWVTVLLEYTLPIALWFKKMLWWAVPVGLILHGLFYYLTSVGTYSLTMWMLYLVFFDPKDVHAWIDRISGHGGQEQKLEA